MVTEVPQIPIPPVPTDPPAVFGQKASDAFDGLYRAIPKINQAASEIEQIGQDAGAAKVRAIAEADAAMGYRNEAVAARNQIALDRQGAENAKVASQEAKAASQQARDESAAYAASMAQAIAMAATFVAVPSTFQAWMIVVTQPHLRVMVWDGAKYVRAPWHQPCQLFFSYDNPASIPGALPVRGDVTWNQSDFPDVVARLGLAGTGTFTLAEARGEGIRVLDNGRGVDVGRVLRSAQGDAIRNITGNLGYAMYPGGVTPSGTSAVDGSYQSGNSWSAGSSNVYLTTLNASRQVPTANEVRMRNIAFPLWMTF